MVDLHCHDEASIFDGFGKSSERAEYAKQIGHTSLSTSNHGSLSGNVKTYMAAKSNGLKAILGVEAYFLPKLIPQHRGYHLCLFVKNLEGFSNLNKIMLESEKQKYYSPITTFDILRKYHKGIICSSACVGGYLAQCIIKDKMNLADKFLDEMVDIFGDDFYIEIQPYVVSEKGMQEKVNYHAIKFANKKGIKCILTSDSHRVKKEDMSTYLKMHEIAGHNLEHIESTYSERYMPTEDEIVNRFVSMHSDNKFAIPKTLQFAKQMIDNLEEIESKVDDNILDALPLKLPTICKTKKESEKMIVGKVKEGLKKRGKLNKRYIDRCKDELDVINYHGFEDYFLIVEDYVRWAKTKGIGVGPGRGSVCNSIVAYALGITDVDSILLNLDFRRFLRKDKKKFPDIDLDFQTSRRQEVIQYLCEKYKGHAAKIASYGLYKIDNLINDLAKVCGVEGSKEMISRIKLLIGKYASDGGREIDFVGLKSDKEFIPINKQFDNILDHFCLLYNKVRYMGTHAAGVAITGGNLLDYTALTCKNNEYYTSYDLSDLEALNIIKFDILGLKTMESIVELRNTTGVVVDYDEIITDEILMDKFGKGECDGIFQFEKPTARNILKDIHADCFEDIVAASSMNRPGPLGMKMPQTYASNKMNAENTHEKHWEYTKETYGTIVYQEQIQQICINIGKLTWADADTIMKFVKGVSLREEDRKKAYLETKAMIDKFAQGAKQSKYSYEEAEELFKKFLVYSFNKGHAAGYSLLSVEEMFYKVYYPNEYWYVKLRYAKDESESSKFSAKAVKDGSVIFLPHVNYSLNTSLRKVDGENAIQLGISSIKNVGEKAAKQIEDEKIANGIFTSYDNFYDRCKSRAVTTRVISSLQEQGALEFNKKIYISRVTKYNSSLFMRGT